MKIEFPQKGAKDARCSDGIGKRGGIQSLEQAVAGIDYMKSIKEISYTDVFQRRVLFLNAFFTYVIIMFLLADSAYNLYYLDVYGNAVRTVALYGLFAFLLGNLLGGLILKKTSTGKIYIITDFLFLLISLLLLLKNTLIDNVPILSVVPYGMYHVYLGPVFSLVAFLTGIKSNYFLKITCGTFIDDKKGVLPFVLMMIVGSLIGLALFSTVTLLGGYHFLGALLIVPIMPTVFIIRFAYNLPSRYAQETIDGPYESQKEGGEQEDVYFVFLNFSFITIYIYLGYLYTVKFYGCLFPVQLLFFAVVSCSILAGCLAARILRNVFWFIFSAMLFPVVFLCFVFMVHYFGIEVVKYQKIFFFALPATVFGFALFKTIGAILDKKEQSQRFNLLNISIFILPIPIMIALMFLEFTIFWFNIFMYVLMTVNVVLPGINLVQRRIDKYKKALFFSFSLLFIPAVYFFHNYMGTNLTGDLFIKHIRGFQLLYNNKYNSLYVDSDSNVNYHGFTVFINNDNAIRNLNRAILPVFLYAGVEPEKKDIMFIDGNQRFYRNISIAYFKNYRILDYVPDRFVDYHLLPLAGTQKYIAEREKLHDYIQRKGRKYDIIIDIPNVFDQQLSGFRFSKSYYGMIKNRLKNNGIYAQVFNLRWINEEYVTSARNEFARAFKKAVGFQFADQVLTIGSASKEALLIGENNVSALSDLLSNSPELSYLFFDVHQLLSHCIFHDLESNEKPMIPFKEFINSYVYKNDGNLDGSVKKRFIESVNEIEDLIPGDGAHAAFKRKILHEIGKNQEIYTLFKEAELAGVDRDYEKEAELIKKIGTLYGYRGDIKKYVDKISSVKQEFYYNSAIELEKEKKWEDAKKLYSSLMILNESHFDANYRMGLLHITLQNINEAFTYMKRAMTLKNDDPRVQYQMGVLLFSNGKASEALNYLERAQGLKQDSSSLYLYIGFCYEELGKMYDAKNYYHKAALKDPNDSNVKLSIERINKKIQDEVEKWKTKEPESQIESEQGENIPLPINKSAYEYRITDEEAKKVKNN